MAVDAGEPFQVQASDSQLQVRKVKGHAAVNRGRQPANSTYKEDLVVTSQTMLHSHRQLLAARGKSRSLKRAA